MIDPRNPDFSCPPGSPGRPPFGYAPARETDAPPSVTIVTPFYNTAPDIFEETARTVLAQSLQSFEWLIVNDGSTDADALAGLAPYRDRDPRIRVIDHEVNKGLSAARNTGYTAARSELVCMLDSDDLIEPTFLEKCVMYLHAHPGVGFVKGWSTGFGHHAYLWKHGFHKPRRFLSMNSVDPTSVVRKRVWQAVGGFDETNRGGLEDWEFWLAAASKGHWGNTIPEYLNWYRRRGNHGSSWSNWDQGPNQTGFHDKLKARYANLWEDGFPRIARTWHQPMEPLRLDAPFTNPLEKMARRLLMVVPWLRMGGADKWNLDLVRQLTERGWEVTVVATNHAHHTWLPEFTRYTPDVFLLEHYVDPADMPWALRHLIDSRRPDAVLVTNSELAYHLLPALRTVCPEPAYLDYVHMEEEYWKSGGYPRYAAGTQELLDLNITASEHIKHWMIDRGADASRIESCTINVDPEEWKPDPDRRAATRAELGLGDETPLILYAGRLCDQKQPLVFARTMKELAKRADDAGVDFHAIVAGDGPDRSALTARLKADKLRKRVTLLGEVAPDRMRDLMAAADVFFLPSKWEGIPLVFFEAMATGVPIVGADVGGQRELVAKGCGVLLPKAAKGCELADEPTPYAEALLGLILDPDRRRRMADASRARILDRFTLDAMGARMIELFDRAIDLHASAPRALPAEPLARELATRGLDYIRLNTLNENLWTKRTEMQQELATAAEKLERLERRIAKLKGDRLRLRRNADARAARLRRELDDIRNSRSHKIVVRLKSSLLYRLLRPNAAQPADTSTRVAEPKPAPGNRAAAPARERPELRVETTPAASEPAELVSRQR
ncbi:MAG: glycosyltransferase [Phycisphaerales bacterium JB037]